MKILRPFLKTVNKIIINLYQVKSPKTIWIIGSPRSGSTLLYNLLVDNFELNYINNYSARYHEIVCLRHLISKLLMSKYGSNSYDFELGFAKGKWAPNEAGNFFYKFFPPFPNVYVSEGEMDEQLQSRFKAEVSCLYSIEQKPLIFKNTYNSMRIAPIFESFENPLFIVCKRDYLDIAQSIYKARKQTGNLAEWWSVPPKEFEEIKDYDVTKQIVNQIQLIYKQIENDKLKFGKNNFFEINYEFLCKNTSTFLNDIESFLNDHSVDVNRRTEIELENINYSSGQKIDDVNFKKIKKELGRYEKC